MTTGVAAAAGRPRPLSGSFRTFFSWLKKDEKLERNSSLESLSSNGSDSTVTSFAFLSPAHYTSNTTDPITLPPPGPPTDSYRKRIRDRNLRRQLDRDLTLCRKYHLPADTVLSLPNARRRLLEPDRYNRERRAASETLPRRAPYVPGKRRAPEPPTNTTAPSPVKSLSNRRTRKRQAPQPPKDIQSKFNKEIDVKENNKMNENKKSANKKLHKSKTVAQQEEKNSNHTQRNFLKQIFEGKKRISVCDPIAVRLLPNISELDRQAAEILQMKMRNAKLNNCSTDNYKLQDLELSVSLKDKQKKTKIENTNIQVHKNVNVVNNDRQELKKMLKEMKDSIPKNPESKTLKNDSVNHDNIMQASTSNVGASMPTEASTLRIGSTDNSSNWQWSPIVINKEPITHDVEHRNLKINPSRPFSSEIKIQSAQVSGFLSCVNNKSNVNEQRNKLVTKKDDINIPRSDKVAIVTETNNNFESMNVVTNTVVSIMPPPVKCIQPQIQNISNNDNSRFEDIKPTVSNASTSIGSTVLQESNVCNVAAEKRIIPNQSQKSEIEIQKSTPKDNQETKRNNLIIELENCIANGDEQGAAKAAMRLAKLRVSNTAFFTSSLNKNLETKPSSSIAQIKPTLNQPTKSNNECDVVKETPRLKIVTNNPIPDVIPSTSKESNTQDMKVVQKTLFSQLLSNPGENSRQESEQLYKKDVKMPTKVKNIIEEKYDEPEHANGAEVSTENNHQNFDELIPVEVWVEDRVAARGPILLHLKRNSDLKNLRIQAEKSLGLPSQLQRWIVGRNLCNDDNATLEKLAGPELRTPFYVCLVEAEKNKGEAAQSSGSQSTKEADAKDATENKTREADDPRNVYTELIQLEQRALLPNTEVFECGVCIEEYQPGDGVVLRECVHTFCRDCLMQSVRLCEEAVVKCPAAGCAGLLEEREVRALVSAEEYERWLARGLAAAESGSRHAFHCRTRDCAGWALCEPGVRRFPCPVCKRINCVPCQAIHEGITCEQHRVKLKEAETISTDTSIEDEGTRNLLKGLIERGEALECPQCNAIITKKWGCDWVRCSACKTEICWVTRGRRWGPAGRGDTSAGCRCGVDGKRCHPSCSYCH